MSKAAQTFSPALTAGPGSIILIQGAFAPRFFDELGKKGNEQVFVTEGRPSLNAAGSAVMHLTKRRMTPVLISDNMAGFLFYKGLVKEAWIAYRAADKEGALCDIGALILGVLGKKHAVPVNLFPAESHGRLMGKPAELRSFLNQAVAPKDVRAYVPLAEWLPRKYITQVF